MRKSSIIVVAMILCIISIPICMGAYTYYFEFIFPMLWVHNNIEYCVVAGNIWRTAPEILQSGKGSCKDMTILLMYNMKDKDHIEMLITQENGKAQTHAAVLVRRTLVLDPSTGKATKKYLYMEGRKEIRSIPYSRVNAYVHKSVL